MALVIVQAAKETSESKKILRDLMWYDTENKVMRHFSGTRLEFDYKPDPTIKLADGRPKYRLLPRVVVAAEQIKVKGGDSRHIMKWFREYKNYNDSEAEILLQTAKDESICFEVPDEEVDDFCDEAKRNKFRCELL